MKTKHRIAIAWAAVLVAGACGGPTSRGSAERPDAGAAAGKAGASSGGKGGQAGTGGPGTGGGAGTTTGGPDAGAAATPGSAGVTGGAGTSGGAGLPGTAGAAGTLGQGAATGMAGQTGGAGQSGMAGAPGMAGATGMAGQMAGQTGAAGQTAGQPGTAGQTGGAGQTGTAGVSGVGGTTPVGAQDGLTAWYAFDEGSGLTVKDNTGKSPAAGLFCWDNANNLLTQDGSKCGNGLPSWSSSGRFGGSIENSYWKHEQVPASTQLDPAAGKFTVAVWVRRIIPHVDARAEILVARKTSAGDGDLYRLFLAGGIPSVTVAGQTVSATKALTDTTTWHHVAATYDGASLALYVDGGGANGEAVSRAVGALTLAASTAPLTVGAELVGGVPNNWSDAANDDVRFYTRALTAAEIAALQ